GLGLAPEADRGRDPPAVRTERDAPRTRGPGGHLQAGALLPRDGIPQVSPHRLIGRSRDARGAVAIRVECHEHANRGRGQRPSGGDVPTPRVRALYSCYTSALRASPPPHGRDARAVGAQHGITEVDALFVEVEQLLAVQIPDGEAALERSRSRAEGDHC